MYWLTVGRHHINLEHVTRFTLESETGIKEALLHFVDGGVIVLDERLTERFADEYYHYLKQDIPEENTNARQR